MPKYKPNSKPFLTTEPSTLRVKKIELPVNRRQAVDRVFVTTTDSRLVNLDR